MSIDAPNDYRQQVLKERERIFNTLVSAKGLKKRKILIGGGYILICPRYARKP
jgi:hypothetical protein